MSKKSVTTTVLLALLANFNHSTWLCVWAVILNFIEKSVFLLFEQRFISAVLFWHGGSPVEDIGSVVCLFLRCGCYYHGDRLLFDSEPKYYGHPLFHRFWQNR